MIDNDGFVAEAAKNINYEKKNEELKRQINSYPLIIDRSVFKKTKEEKELVNNLKTIFKNRNK